MGQFSVTIYGATGSVLSDNQHMSKRALAVEAGAVEVTMKELARITRARREAV